MAMCRALDANKIIATIDAARAAPWLGLRASVLAVMVLTQ
jgi:hypothetical protein